MSTDPRLAALPALRKRAEEEAKALHRVIFGHLVGGERLSAWTEAQLTLLSDLTRPASRDAVARLVAAKARIKVYALHALLAGAIPYPPEWSTDLCDRVAAAESEAEALTLIALAVFGGAS